jgi:hypothetical protein
MPNLTEDRLSSLLADWIASHRHTDLPDSLPILVARRDEIRTRPCIVINPAESKPVPAMPTTARIKLDIHLFSQVDDTPAESHATWSAALAEMLSSHQRLGADLNSPSFFLHTLQPKDSTTTPDESRGRETTLSYEAVVSAI